MKRYIFTIIFLWIVRIAIAQSTSPVVITQIMYDSPLNEQVTSTPYSNGEFVELYNMNEQDIDMSQWILRGDGVTETFIFPSGTTIRGKGYLLIAFRHKKSPDFVLSSMYSNTYSSPILYQNKVILKNAGEAIRLHNQHGMLVDSVYFDGTSHKTKPNRLSADNADGIAGDSCISLQRKYVTYNSYGSPITDNSHWGTQHVRLGTIVPIIQPYITSDFYWEQGRTVSSGSNYIIRVNPIDECSSVSFGENGNVSIPHGCRAQITITHFNEHGQSVQTTHKSASPTGEDIVLYTEYNRNARTIRNWLPIATDGVNQLSLEEVQSFATTQYNDTAPYTTTHKELSRRARTKSSITAGETYQNHAVRLEYDINNQVVPRFIVTDNGFMVQGEYPIGSLRGTIAIDADGKKQSTFVDMDGRTIVTRLGDDLDTYYVYDDLGRLCYVLPPAITSQINNSSSFSNEDELIRNYAYVYKYDKRGNQIYKRLPGAEHICMVYDKAGRLALQQDGNQRLRGNIWLMTKYDAYGRNIYSLECDMQEWDHDALLDTISNLYFTEQYTTTSTSTMLDNSGYTNALFAMSNSKILVINYYDNYDFLDHLPTNQVNILQYKNAQDYSPQYEDATGLATGSISYNLSDEQYTITTNYYDVYGNIIQVRNTSLEGGYHVAHTAYNLDGTKSKLLLQHHTNHVPTQTEKYAYSYDHVGRPTQTIYQLNDNPSVLYTQMHYDQRGQLTQMLRHNAQDSTLYQYNTQGALTKLSNAHFSEQLFYADSLPNYATPYYNGNISATSVYLGDSAYHFAYDYDDYNRLFESFHLRDSILHTNEYFEFDVMGNLNRLQRYSLQNRMLDDLAFTLDGNRIRNIVDYAIASDLYDTKEYYDRATATDMPDMLYDANGNLKCDLDRNIDSIKYNIYNLPDTVIFSNGNKIINHYTASGNKWKTEYHTIIDAMYLPNTADGTVFEGNVVDIHYTIYDGNIEYKYIVNSMGADSLYEYVIHNTEGYIAYHPQNNTMTHYYYHQDHLGNICAVWDATHDSIVQQTLYYASGLPVSVSTGQDVQPYKYNGKEYVEMHGLDEYDNEARWYYPAICRTTTMDPLAEKYYSTSPYAWCGNNPVRNIDNGGAYYYDWDNKVYRSSYGNHDIVSWGTIVDNNFIEPVPNDGVTPLILLLEFFSGFGEKNRDFIETDYYTQQFIKDNEVLDDIYDQIALQIYESQDKPLESLGYSLGNMSEDERMRIFYKDILAILTAGKTKNLYSAILGSFQVEWSLMGFNPNGDAIVTITAKNTFTAESALRNPKTGYSEEWKQTKGKHINKVFQNGFLGTQIMRPTTQSITWTITIGPHSK